MRISYFFPRDHKKSHNKNEEKTPKLTVLHFLLISIQRGSRKNLNEFRLIRKYPSVI
jgi:hypothetical protein